MKLLWAVTLGLGLATVAGAGEKTADGSYAGEVTASRLQLRAGPAEAYQPVATLRRGELVVVLGRHPNAPEWLTVELPQGYHAWVHGSFLAVPKDGTAKVTGDSLLVRPKATTRYHQLNGRLDRGDTVKVVGKAQTKEGLWYKIVVPRRFPLYAHARFLRNVGPASLAEPKKGVRKPAPEVVVAPSELDAKYTSIEKVVLNRLEKAKTSADVQPLRRAIMEIDPKKLNASNRDRRVVLLGKIIKVEREVAIAELNDREQAIHSDLERKLAEIEERYKDRLRRIREGLKPRKPRYAATGIVEFRPDIFGRTPSFVLEKGKQMRFFLIAPDYDLSRFVGKRVGVIGLTDPESGTGYHTVMVKRIEILSDK